MPLLPSQRRSRGCRLREAHRDWKATKPFARRSPATITARNTDIGQLINADTDSDPNCSTL